MLLRRRCIDAVEAEAETPPGPDATKHITLYVKVLDGLTELQFDLGLLERVSPRRASTREAVPSGKCLADYSPAERARMEYGSITKGMTPPEQSGGDSDGIPTGNDA